MNVITHQHAESLDTELRCVEQIIVDIQSHSDLKSLLLRITSLQQAVFDEVHRRNRLPLQ